MFTTNKVTKLMEVKKMAKSKYYVYYQPNEKDSKNKYGDCVVRALTKAFNEPWLTVYYKLFSYSIMYQCMPNEKVCYESYIKDNRGEWLGIKAVEGSHRPTVETFTKHHQTGTYILRVAGHLVCVKDGKYHDTWDCGHKAVYGYWTINLLEL